MPFRWARLAQVDVGDFHMGNVPGAVARQGDAWAGWLSRKARIEDALAAAAR
jgi:DNA primase